MTREEPSLPPPRAGGAAWGPAAQGTTATAPLRRCLEEAPGVYAVALTASPNATKPTVKKCPVSEEAVEHLLRERPRLRVDGQRPEVEALASRVSGFWLPDEVVLYVGLTGTSLRQRVGQYYRTPLGARKPHAGGWFLKLLRR